ncbi:MAG: hypothetical protein KIS87_11125 [Phycisphaeraceae bacterium]|nr:hypothetical protein [Phycisphaeraceae bacterium]
MDFVPGRTLREDRTGGWAERLSGGAWARTARVLKEHEGSRVFEANASGAGVVVKVWPIAGLRRRVQLLTGTTRGHRHWRGAERLARVGVATARPLWLATARIDGLPVVVLAMERVEGGTLLSHLADGTMSEGDAESLAGAVGEQVGAIVRSGLFNRDHKPSNLIVTGVGGAMPSVAVVDCVAVRRSRGRRLGPMARMIASLLIEPAGVGSPVPMRMVHVVFETAVAAAFPLASDDIRRRLTWVVVRLVGRRVAAHGDPTPLHDPLA